MRWTDTHVRNACRWACFLLNMVWGEYCKGLGRDSGANYEETEPRVGDEEEEEDEDQERSEAERSGGKVDEMSRLPGKERSKAREAFKTTCELLAKALRDIESISECPYKAVVEKVFGMEGGVLRVVDMLDSLRKDQVRTRQPSTRRYDLLSWCAERACWHVRCTARRGPSTIWSSSHSAPTVAPSSSLLRASAKTLCTRSHPPFISSVRCWP